MTDLAEFVETMQQEFDAFVAEKKSEIRAAAVQAMADQRRKEPDPNRGKNNF